MTDFIVFVDFDITLFDTHRFRHDFYKMLAAEAGLPAAVVEKDSYQYFADQDLGGYGYVAHLQTYGLNHDHMWQRLSKLLSANDYLYSDSRQFIASLQQAGYAPQILSFGEPRFQTAKIEAAQALLLMSGIKPVDYQVVFRKKRDYIAELDPCERGVLIDDKPDQDLPTGFMEINLDRTKQLGKPQKTSFGYVASDLLQTLDIICKLPK